MTYPLNIIINNRIWYDSRILETHPVVFQNVNYATGDNRSVNRVRQRFMQDWARRIIPNSVRQGIGLTDPVGASEDIIITQGYAVIGGRFLDVPAGTWSASTGAVGGGSISTGTNYLMIRVTPETEADDRDPTLESAALIGVLVTAYTSKSHDDLILAKFDYNGSIIDQFADYTKEQEWQANVISPPATRPGLSTAPNEDVLLRAGGLQRVDVMNIETDKARFYLNAVFDDQDATPVGEVKLINNDAILEVSNLLETALLGMTMLDLKTGAVTGVQRIDSSGNLLNIGTINARTMGGNTSTDLIDTDSVQTLDNKTLTSETVISSFWQDSIAGSNEITVPAINDTLVTKTSTDTLTNKTLTSPIITGGTLNSGVALTVTSTELNQVADGFVRGGTSTGDIVTIDATQTLSNKTMRDLIFNDTDGSNTAEITLPNLTGDKTYAIPRAESDTFLLAGHTNTISGTLAFSGDSDFLLTPGQWTGAQHDHTAANDGGTLSITGATTGILSIAQGGTGANSVGSYDLVVGNSVASAYESIPSPVSGRLLRSNTAATPVWDTNNISVTLTGDVTGEDTSNLMSSGGDWTIRVNTSVGDDTHTHGMSNLALQRYNYPANLLYSDVVGDVTITQNNHTGFHMTFGAAGTGEVWFRVPYVFSKNLLVVTVGGQADASRSISGRLYRYNGAGGNAAVGNLTSDTFTTSHAGRVYGVSYSDSGNLKDGLWFKFYRPTAIAAVIKIASISFTYL